MGSSRLLKNDLSKSMGKPIKINLFGGMFYKGIVFYIDDEFIKLNDKNGQEQLVRISSIITLKDCSAHFNNGVTK